MQNYAADPQMLKPRVWHNLRNLSKPTNKHASTRTKNKSKQRKKKQKEQRHKQNIQNKRKRKRRTNAVNGWKHRWLEFFKSRLTHNSRVSQSVVRTRMRIFIDDSLWSCIIRTATRVCLGFPNKAEWVSSCCLLFGVLFDTMWRSHEDSFIAYYRQILLWCRSVRSHERKESSNSSRVFLPFLFNKFSQMFVRFGSVTCRAYCIVHLYVRLTFCLPGITIHVVRHYALYPLNNFKEIHKSGISLFTRFYWIPATNIFKAKFITGIF